VLPNLGSPLFGATIFPVAFVVLVRGEVKLQDNKNWVLELFFLLIYCFFYVLLNFFFGAKLAQGINAMFCSEILG
jgi:hypothetical protein